jgi:hypothetical protein
MTRILGAATPRLRVWVALLLGTAIILLVPSLTASTADASSAVLLAALVTALAAALAVNGSVATLLATSVTAPARFADRVPALMADRVTDTIHHPLRPRAPGSV